MKSKLKYIIASILILAFTVMGSVCASAEEISEPESTVEVHESDANFFEKVYEEVMAYTSEILCALTFAGSIGIAFAYKKGLLPLVEGSLVAIGNAVTKIKENTKENTEISSQLGESITGRLAETQELLTRLTERIGTLERTLGSNIKSESDARLEMGQLRLVVDTQIDMLYDIFMSSALPQYQKDRIGAAHAAAMALLGESDHE